MPLTSPATGVWFAGSPGAHECAITALPGTQRHRLGFVKLGGRRRLVACSYAYPNASSLSSLYAVPVKEMFTGLYVFVPSRS